VDELAGAGQPGHYSLKPTA
jgi:hypothetical protein